VSPAGAHRDTSAGERGIGRGLVLLLAVACGAAVANLYYAQPLLSTLAHAFGVSDGTAGLLVTFSQVGYVIGLALLVPLGDLLERRRLITATVLLVVVADGLTAAAPSFGVFAALLLLAGVAATVAQIVVPMASHLARESERGRVVGTVMSGLLIGILLARTASGLIAAAFGWRTVFVVAAAVMLVLDVALLRALPDVEPTSELGYGAALRSVLTLVRREPVLRQRMVLGALAFGCFSVLWTSLSFLLSAAPFHYGNATIGLFGLAGAAGASIAPLAGRLHDAGRGRLAATATILVLLGSWGLLALGHRSVVVLIAGIIALDLGVQGLHISNQSTIYGLHGEARSRLTTAYMVAYFLGGAALSAASSEVYAAAGWSGVCALGAGTAVLALAFWMLTDGLLHVGHGRSGGAERRPARELAGTR
jgi:predicted MFS family arabinose efflux permease